MPRKARSSLETAFYHLMVQGMDRENIFEAKESKKSYIEMLKKYKNEDVNIYAYCIMSNHAHLLIECEKVEKLSFMMKKINTSYALGYNKSNRRVGFVFRNRYKTEGIYDQKHLISCMVYIHNNPVKAGICGKCEEYEFSSFNEYKNNKANVADTTGFNKLTGLDSSAIIKIHKKPDAKEWMDVKNCRDYFEVYTEFLNAHEKNDIEEVINDKGLLKEFIIIVQEQTGISLRSIALTLGLNREYVRKIAMSFMRNGDGRPMS